MGGGGLTNERPGTDHVISGSMRGLNRQTDKHPDIATL